MAEAGGQVSLVYTVGADPVQVAQSIGMAVLSNGNYLDDTQVVPVGPTTFRITRRYLPQWAVVCAIIGLFLCGLGLIALFFRDTEELLINIEADAAGSRITVAGVGKPSLITTVQSVLARFEGYAPQMGAVGSSFAAPGQPVGGVTMSPDRAWWWDGATWQSATTSSPPSAQRSPDGRHWWDGTEWRLDVTSSPAPSVDDANDA